MGKGTAEQQLAERMRDKPGIGTRVRVTHKPEHDNVNLGRFMSFRSTSTGKIGFVEGHSPDGDLLVGIDGAGATWWHPDEVIAAPIFAETCESLRDELANEKAAHAEAERLLSAERAALEVSRAKVLDLEMRAVEAERLLSEARRQIADAHAAFDKAGALTHMIGNESRGIDEQRATLAERAEDIQQARIEAERRENEARVDAEIARAESLKTRQDAQEARDRLSRVKAAVDALRRETDACLGGFDGSVEHIGAHFDAVDRALAGVTAPKVGSPLDEALARLAAGEWTATVIALAVETWKASRVDLGEAPREPTAEQPRTDLVALADAIEANGRTWQRVDPSTLAKALRAVDRRMGTLEAAVTALAASVEQVQTKAGIGGETADPRFNGTEAHGCIACETCKGFRLPNRPCAACEGRKRLHEGDPAAKVAGPWTLIGKEWQRRPLVKSFDFFAGLVCVQPRLVSWSAWNAKDDDAPIAEGLVGEGQIEAGKARVDAALRAAGWTLQDAPEKPASPQQGDGSGRLVLGHIDGQPIRARYTGVTPTEPRKP